MRRSFISYLLDSGADIGLVAKLSRHRQLATVARYDRRDAEAQKRAAGLLHVPFRKGQP
jgi:site-specific recombinase XerD